MLEVMGTSLSPVAKNPIAGKQGDMGHPWSRKILHAMEQLSLGALQLLELGRSRAHAAQ